MAIGVYFTHGNFTPDKYREALSQLEAAGAGAPPGRSYHVALETDGENQPLRHLGVAKLYSTRLGHPHADLDRTCTRSMRSVCHRAILAPV